MLVKTNEDQAQTLPEVKKFQVCAAFALQKRTKKGRECSLMLAGREGLQSKGCATRPVRKYTCIYIQGDRSEWWICRVPASYITPANRKAGLQEGISQN